MSRGWGERPDRDRAARPHPALRATLPKMGREKRLLSLPFMGRVARRAGWGRPAPTTPPAFAPVPPYPADP